MSSKIPTLLVVVLVINAMILWWTAVLAQSAELLDAIKTAKEQQEQGKLAEAFKTLTAVKPTNSEESSRKDKSLQELVKAFLTNRQSENATKVALHIANPPMRNSVMFRILEIQRNTVWHNPEGAEQMLGKAEKTAKLLTGRSRDEGYWIIAVAYAHARLYDRSLESFKRIENTEYRDERLLAIVSHNYYPNPYPNSGLWQRDCHYLRDVCDLIQSPLLRTRALVNLASRCKKEGKNDVALKILTAIRPIVSETNRLSSPELEKPYGIAEADRDLVFGYSYPGLWDNEFYIKDKALYELVGTFLETKQSERAVLTARHITDRVSRNAVLLGILGSQCNAIRRNPEEFDLMVGKAEKTALLLTGRHRDQGYRAIAERCYFTGKFDDAVETWNKIEDMGYREESLVSILYFVANNSSQAQEKQFLELKALFQTPAQKARALCQLAAFYRKQEAQKIDETDSKQKRLEVLQEAKELLLSLPGNQVNAATLLEIHQHYRDDKCDTEAVINILGEFELLAEKTINPKDLAAHWGTYLSGAVALGWILPESEEQVKAFHRAYNAASQIDEPLERAASLRELVGFASPERTEALLNEIVDLILSSEDEAVARSYNRFRWFETVVVGAAKLHNTEWVLATIHSPRVPDAWKPGLYRKVLMRLYWEARYKYHDEPNDEVLKAAKEIDWSRWIESTLTITDPLSRFETCRSLAGTLCQRKIDVDVTPLIDEMLLIAEMEKDRNLFYHTRQLAQEYSLWDQDQKDDWLKRYEAVLAEEPNAAERFRLLRETLGPGVTPRNVMIDKLIAAAREIPEDNPRARLNAFWETARSADIHGGAPDRAREILDEAIAYAELFPKETRLTLRAEDQLRKVRKLREELQGR